MHILAIILAVVAPFVLGFLWYGPLFQDPWMKEIGHDPDDPQNTSMGLTFGLATILTLVAVLVADTFLISEAATAMQGLSQGLLLGIGVAATALGINYVFSQRSVRLYLIDAGYLVLMFGLIGLFVRVW